MFVEEDAALPERRTFFGIDERVVEKEARQYRTERQHAERDQHRDRAFVRAIARRAFMRVGCVCEMDIVARMLIGRMIVMIAVHGMLDMLARGPARPTEEGQADERSEEGREGEEWCSTCRFRG